ncbi:MAG: hypothetical protein GX647_13375 [Clostridiales bacterium]|nr:hypothetical protein [Clostridiales bacterium]
MKRWIVALAVAVALFAGAVLAVASAEDPAPPDPPAPPEDPIDETGDPEETWTLTIHYALAEGGEAAPDYVQGGLAEGDSYRVVSPAIEGLKPDPETVEGTMPGEDVEIDVVYRAAAPAETWTLTIHYVLAEGGEAAPDYVRTGLSEGEAYEVASPAVEGKSPDAATVSGTMPGANVEVTVVYRTPPAQTWTLTIHYAFEEGGEAAPDYVRTGLSEGEAYEVASPAVEGKSPDPATVSGTMPGANVEVTVVYRTPSAEGWTLRIRYLLEDGSEAAPDYVRTGMKAGDAYEVASPSVRFMAADKPVVSGTMGEGDATIVVTYKIGGGGFGGFSGYGGYGGGMGAAGEMEDMGFTVTPGEAFTSIHTSGDKDASLYGTVPLEAEDAPMTTLTLGGEALDIALTAGGGAAEFTAEIDSGVLTLRGAGGTWSIGGGALKTLRQSGIDAVVLVGGGRAATLPTVGFASGYDYDRLRASGLPSSAFRYAVELSSESVSFTAGGETYALPGGGVRFETPMEVEP